jgi:hypothetical protein
MLHLPISRVGQRRAADAGADGRDHRDDRAMAVLQYGTAGLALVVVGLLMVLR